MAVSYEWSIETVDRHSDIQDSDFSDILSGLGTPTSAYESDRPDYHKALVLVRNVGDDEEGLQDREWAYVIGHKLPTVFDGGETVPQRFHRELDRWFNHEKRGK